VRKLDADGRPVLVSLLPQGVRVDTPGLFGGGPGRRSAIRLEAGEPAREGEELGGLVELRAPDQTLTVELGGGAGYGDPLERPLEAVRRDYAEGLVSERGLAAYGCRLDAGGQVVRAATDGGTGEG
jgi:5-oxoprolinase (ATP-hydrolysing)